MPDTADDPASKNDPQNLVRTYTGIIGNPSHTAHVFFSRTTLEHPSAETMVMTELKLLISRHFCAKRNVQVEIVHYRLLQC